MSLEAPIDIHEQEVLEALDTAVRSARAAIDPIVVSVDRKLKNNPGDVLAWQAIPLERYSTRLPAMIRSSWVFVLRANVATGAERHPNSHQRMMSYRGGGDFQTRQSGKWCSHELRSESAAPLTERWISIPADVWHQGVVGPVDWAVVSFHTVAEHELIEERPAARFGDAASRRKYAGDT